MAFVDIHTNNLSRRLRNATTFIDNWVYVPGTAITGDWSQPYAITSVEQFENQFGTYGPESSPTFAYVTGLLNAGLPVIFRRIACVDQDKSSEESGVVQASRTISHTVSGTEIPDYTVYEKYGGTFGNHINILTRDTGIAYYLDVYYDYTLLESKKVYNKIASDDDVARNTKIIEALQTLEWDRIVIDVPADVTPQTFVFTIFDKQSKYLENGADFNENLVINEIPKSYEVLQDKILFQPKFITSGGYTDTYITEGEHAGSLANTKIGTAMKELTKLRQDCRAVIDLPSNVDKQNLQTIAADYAYQQLASTEPIPSACTFAPWCYMQVGSEQLWMPPSYVYLATVGSDLSAGGAVYTPKAGLSTGRVTNILRPQFEIGQTLSEKWQEDGAVQINPIMRLQSGSYIIAGNSTLLLTDVGGEEENAFTESSADLTIIEIRRYVYNLAAEMQYQYNGTTAFENFSLRMAKFLDKMHSESAVTSYDIYNLSSDEEPRTLKVQVDVYLTPTIKKIELFLNVAYGSIEMSTGGEA